VSRILCPALVPRLGLHFHYSDLMMLSVLQSPFVPCVADKVKTLYLHFKFPDISTKEVRANFLFWVNYSQNKTNTLKNPSSTVVTEITVRLQVPFILIRRRSATRPKIAW
jgi:hypothetical protein